MCVTLLPRQFVEPPSEQQLDQGTVFALKDFDRISLSTTFAEDNVAEPKIRSPLGVASDEDAKASEADVADNGVEAIVAVNTADVGEARSSQRRENEHDEAQWVPPQLNWYLSEAVERCVVGGKTPLSIFCDSVAIQLFLSPQLPMKSRRF